MLLTYFKRLFLPLCSPTSQTFDHSLRSWVLRLLWPLATPYVPVYPDRYHDHCLRPYVPRLLWPLSTLLCSPSILTAVYAPMFPVYPDPCLYPSVSRLSWPLSTHLCSCWILSTPTAVYTPMFPVYPDRFLHSLQYVPRLSWPLSTPLWLPSTLPTVYTPTLSVCRGNLSLNSSGMTHWLDQPVQR
jgi:hypothetical protein